MTIDANTLERAIRRFWWRRPKFENVPFVELPTWAQRMIFDEAVEMENDL